MKAILEFDLNDIDEEKRFNKATSSVRYSIALWELYHIRSHFKHYDRAVTFDEVLEYINEVFETNNININELD
jgi:hypothetical protein